jgi:uncharacterized membrane protein YfcA
MDSLPGISIEAIIERLFRFIEMVVIATLIGVVMTVVSPEASKLASGDLALLAGTFVGVPVGRWLATLVQWEGQKHRRGAFMLAASIGFSMIAF